MNLLSAKLFTNDAGDTRIAARWEVVDDYGRYEFNAIHDADGKPLASNLWCKAPRLTADQMATATPDRHPAYELADKGAAAKPALAKRMQKAARLVEAGAVVRNAEHKATVAGDSGEYAVDLTAKRCECSWMNHHPGDPCSHFIAARMARALGQEVVTGNVSSETDFQLQQRKYDAQAKRNAEFKKAQYEDDAAFKKWCNSPEGARRYMLKAYANGRIAAPAGSKLHQKQQQARQQTLVSERAYWAEQTRQLFAGGD